MKTDRQNRMGRRAFLQGAMTGAAALPAGMLAPEEGEPAPNRPNILFVLSDQQRWDSVDCYGAPLFPGLTPHLDQLARKGVRFQYAFTPQPVCAPARSVLQTGRWATETGVYRNGIPMDPRDKTLARYLRETGYETGYVGKWHLAPAASGGNVDLQHAVSPEYQGGYEHWVGCNLLEMTSHAYDGHMFDGKMQKIPFPPDRYRADCLTDYAIDFLRTRDRRRPFFLFLSYIEPHHQNDHKHFEGPRGSKDRFKGYRVPVDLPGSPMEGDWREEMPDYLGCCNSLDMNLGRLRDQLKSMGADENTLIVYTSDHACHFRTHEGEYKRSCHDNAIRIPMILCGPGFSGGRVVEELVSLIDLPPTVLSAANLAVPDLMRGRPLQGPASGKARNWRQEVFVQISEAGIGRAVRTRKWTYSVEAPPGTAAAGSDVYFEKYLFDLEADPGQHRNLIADPGHDAVRNDLKNRLRHLMAQAGEKEPEIRPGNA